MPPERGAAQYRGTTRYVVEFRDFLKDGKIPERKALFRNFAEEIETVGDEPSLTYAVHTPIDRAMPESA